ncbi:hypothetical protein [Streptomyces formicae]|uniref:Uncharacterized protein n=1 Tax=Streptomyces formicae TaxID=1616117 RepID=A0ABY3WI87_9ACTN|nr:hypothetical protein [Streptomyces formicae]UNM12317.1 hypothetical protein J4032_12930 [Streptomyces formicae]
MSPEEKAEQFAKAQQDVERLLAEGATSWLIVSALWRRFEAMKAVEARRVAS